jgi:HEAT repeat protein
MSYTCKNFLNSIVLCLFFAVIIVPLRVSAKDLDGIGADLSSEDWKVRMAAVEKLEKRKDDGALSLLMQVAGARNEYWPIKVKAILFLGETRDPRAVDILLSTFNDTFSNWECPSIKSYTAIALGNFKGNPKVVDALLNGVSDRELLTREASIQSLGKIGDARAIQDLVGLLGDRSAAIRLSAIKALEGIGDPRAIPGLERLAESDSESVVKTEALAALSSLHGKK